MALRWASVGACENAGVATANSAVTINAACAVAGINVLIILKNPYCCRWSRRFNENETLKKSIKKFSVASFSFSSSTASRLLLFAHHGKSLDGKLALQQDGMGHGNGASAFVHRAERRREA
jgi:hypothetical protein